MKKLIWALIAVLCLCAGPASAQVEQGGPAYFEISIAPYAGCAGFDASLAGQESLRLYGFVRTDLSEGAVQNALAGARNAAFSERGGGRIEFGGLQALSVEAVRDDVFFFSLDLYRPEGLDKDLRADAFSIVLMGKELSFPMAGLCVFFREIAHPGTLSVTSQPTVLLGGETVDFVDYDLRLASEAPVEAVRLIAPGLALSDPHYEVAQAEEGQSISLRCSLAPEPAPRAARWAINVQPVVEVVAGGETYAASLFYGLQSEQMADEAALGEILAGEMIAVVPPADR